jgi:hypothetical protein
MGVIFKYVLFDDVKIIISLIIFIAQTKIYLPPKLVGGYK